MSNYSNTKATIAANVYTNHNNEVTAEMVKTGINAVVDTLIAGGFIYKGVATTSTNPGSPDANVFYIATAPGTYTNFGSLVVADGEVAILKYNGSWSKEVTGAATAAQVSALGHKLIKLTGFGTYGGGAGVTQTGDVYYNTNTKLLRKCIVFDATYETIPYLDGAIYTYDDELYVWNGTDLVCITNEVLEIGLRNLARYANENGFPIQTIPGSYILANGTINTSQYGFLSEIYPTMKGCKYKYTGKTLYNNARIFIIFDKDMNVLRSESGNGTFTDYPVSVTEDAAAYIRFGGYSEVEIQTPYAVPDNSHSVYLQLIQSINNQIDGYFTHGINLFDKNAVGVLADSLISGSSIVTLSGYYVSAPIAVRGNVQYKWTWDNSLNKGGWICDSQGNRISSFTYTTADGYATYTFASDCFIRINIGRYPDTFMICVTAKFPTYYVPYKEFLLEKYSLNEKQIGEVKDFAQDNRLWGKIVALDGDSICQGASQYDSIGGYGKIIAGRNNMTYENKAVGGGTIKNNTYSGGTPRHWICESVSTLRADADYIIIEGGVNDGNTNKGAITTGYDGPFDKSTFCGGMEEICYVLNTRFAGKKVGFILAHRMTPDFSFEGDQDNLYWLAVKILEKWGIPYCDLNKECPPFEAFENSSVQALQDVAAAYVPDGWHPNTDGYEKYYCDKIEEWMQGL